MDREDTALFIMFVASMTDSMTEGDEGSSSYVILPLGTRVTEEGPVRTTEEGGIRVIE